MKTKGAKPKERIPSISRTLGTLASPNSERSGHLQEKRRPTPVRLCQKIVATPNLSSVKAAGSFT